MGLGKLGGVIGGALGAATGIPGGAAIGAAIGGGLGGASTASEAAGISAEAAERQIALQQPFREAGVGAISRLQEALGIAPPVDEGVSTGGGGRQATGRTTSNLAGISRNRLQQFINGEISQEERPMEYAKLQGQLQELANRGLDINTLTQGELDALAASDTQEVEGQKTGEVLPRPGRTAGGTLSEMFESTPGFKFQLEQSEKAIKRAASAGGFSGSGRLYNELVKNAQGLASTTYENYLGNLFRTAEIGQAAASNQAAGVSAAGEARAQGVIGQHQAISGGVNQVLTAAGAGLFGGGGSSAPALPKTSIYDVGSRAGGKGSLEFGG